MGKKIRYFLIFSTILGMAAVPVSGASAVKCPQMSLVEYPRMDGSTACAPLLEALSREVTGCSQTEAEATLSDLSTTDPSYLKLAQQERDLLLAYEPSAETVEALKEYPPLRMEPVGKDALVFLVNQDNPVDSLSAQELFDIYTGKITNWKEVGGQDMPVEAFQRPEASGSQTMMRKLLIGDAEMMPAEEEHISRGMDDIINALKKYDNSANAIGYSVYYYASSMYQQKDLKFLEIDGIAPTNKTIQDGSYPFVNDFYCVTGEHSSREAISIQDWLLTKDGQDFVKENGYVSLKLSGILDAFDVRPDLCAADEYLLLMTDPTYMDIFDHRGNFMGKCRVSFGDEYYRASSVKKTDVLTFNNGETVSVFSMKTLSEILHFDCREEQVQTQDGMTLTVNNTDGTYRLFDNEGTLLYHSETPVPTAENLSFSGLLQSTSDGYLFGVVVYEEHTWETSDASTYVLETDASYQKALCPVWINKEGTEFQVIKNPVLVQAFHKSNLSPFGANLLVYDWAASQGTLYDKEGNLLLERVTRSLYTYGNEFYSYGRAPLSKWLMRDAGGFQEIYDWDLNLHGELFTDAAPSCSEKYIEGLYYEELGNRSCDGFTLYNGTIWLPYTRTEEGCEILMENGELVRFRLNGNETVTSFNDSYRVVQTTVGDTYTQRLIYRKTGENLAFLSWDSIDGPYCQLGKDYAILWETQIGTDLFRHVRVLGPEGTALYEDANVKVFPWVNGYLLVSRGVYQGITDLNGAWVVRNVSEREWSGERVSERE